MSDESNTLDRMEVPRFRPGLPHWGWILLATVTLAAAYPVFSIWLPFKREQQAIVTIKKFARSIETETTEPAWLRPLCEKRPDKWPNPFERVTRVDLVGSAISDTEFASIGALRNLKRLWVNETRITDTGLAHVRGLTGLESLWLDNTQITDNGLAHLNRLTEMKRLSLSGTNITDAGVVHIVGLTKLDRLWLDHTQITNEGVERLQAALPKCQTLPP